MSLMELKMQPTIHLEGKAGYLPRLNPVLRSKCIVGCIFNSVGLIITRESPCMLLILYHKKLNIYKHQMKDLSITLEINTSR
jgi:hypothetical protein